MQRLLNDFKPKIFKPVSPCILQTLHYRDYLAGANKKNPVFLGPL